MRIRPILPDLFAALRIDCVDVGLHVTEVGEMVVRCFLSNDYRGAHTGVGAERPVDAAARGIERVHEAGVGANKDTSARDGRLAVG